MSETLSTIEVSAPEWVRPYPRSLVPAQRRVRVCWMSGIPDCFGYSRDREDGRVWIDATIAPLVAKLNRLGYMTTFCCSALPEDHEEYDAYCGGYISFAEDVRGRAFGTEMPEGFKWEGERIIRGPRIAQPELLRAGWAWLEESLDVRFPSRL